MLSNHMLMDLFCRVHFYFLLRNRKNFAILFLPSEYHLMKGRFYHL